MADLQVPHGHQEGRAGVRRGGGGLPGPGHRGGGGQGPGHGSGIYDYYVNCTI